MPKQIELRIDLAPVPEGRPRMTMRGGRAIAYTPARTRDAQDFIKYSIRQKIKGSGIFDAGVPLKLTAIFVIEKPKSLSKKIAYPVKRPDLDNYLKLLLDALNQYLIPDDSQVVEIIAKKVYSSPPHIWFMLTEVI